MSATQQSMIFDQAEGERRKVAGMNLAANHRSGLLAHIRGEMVLIARVRPDGCCTSDDVHEWLRIWDYPEGCIGNGMGSMFLSSDWEPVGTVKSKRPSAHARRITVWRLK